MSGMYLWEMDDSENGVKYRMYLNKQDYMKAHQGNCQHCLFLKKKYDIFLSLFQTLRLPKVSYKRLGIKMHVKLQDRVRKNQLNKKY